MYNKAMPNIAIKQKSNFTHAIDRLKWVMECLRDPENGCPWDLEQDFKSLLPHTIEEAYEVADAIEQNDMASLKDELGDLLFQVIYYTQMSRENGDFTFDDVASAVAEKMLSRHPHVFGDKCANDASDVNEIWEQQKDKEKTSSGALDNVTKGLPALLRSHKIQKKAAKTGFEWDNSDGALDKVKEEIIELKEATSAEHKHEEFGDLLFALVNYGRMEGINAEEALRKANNKFLKRFQGMEAECAEANKDFPSLTLDEMMECWNRQK